MSNSATLAPDILKLLADDVRWQIVGLLARSDMRVQELVDRVHRPQNLVSYHLKQLREHGLVVERRSSADARDVYYALDLARLRALLIESGQALHPVLAQAYGPAAATAENGRPRTVLFLCTHNSARSQMAEGFLNALGGAVARACSAGIEPTQVHPAAAAVMAQLSVDISGQRSKSIEEFAGASFDLVVTVCDSAREVCRAYPGALAQVHWSIADPAASGGNPEEVRAVFAETARHIRRRVEFLLADITHPDLAGIASVP